MARCRCAHRWNSSAWSETAPSSSLAVVTETTEQIRKHIAVLSKFETDYREFIQALETDAKMGGRSGWSEAKYAERRRELLRDAVRADMAIKASGVGGLVFTEPPAIGGGVRSSDLPSQIFDFIDTGFYSDGMDFQRALLERMPSQIAGLEVRLEEAEARRDRPVRLPKRPQFRWGWLNHPWVIGVGVTVIGGLIVAGVVALVSAA